MARVTLEEERSIDRPSGHAAARGTHGATVGGETLPQIDSYGSASRVPAGRVSQSRQFDAAARRQLHDLRDGLD